jgi:hypothetical protein
VKNAFNGRMVIVGVDEQNRITRALSRNNGKIGSDRADANAPLTSNETKTAERMSVPVSGTLRSREQ